VGRANPKVALLIINSSDRGLCGGFNSTLFRSAVAWIKDKKSKNIEVKLMPIGKKASAFYKRSDLEIIENFEDINTNDRQLEVSENVKNKISELFESQVIDEVSILYNKFVSAIAQEPTFKSLIPLEQSVSEEGSEEKTNSSFEFEPDKNELLEYLIPRNFMTQVYGCILESSAAEHAARMTSMDNATRNAGDMIDSLTMTYNRTRQAVITKELIEIISGAEAV
jgi:F-type H+-transporting ATPase subunit gamma